MVGLVGANGAGKTTLLSILAGELAPHEGSRAVFPPGAVVAYCPQRVDDRGAAIEALAERDDGLASELRGRLRLRPADLTRWATLSPGERKRWQVAAALAQEPEVLLLDEPTNHLDTEARDSLLGALRCFAGVGVVVSHDRAVLDALTWATLRIHDRKVTFYPGAYSEARRVWLLARAQEESAFGAARDRVRQAEARLDLVRRTQAATEKSKSARTRMKDRHDSDARGALATTRASWAEARAGRAVALTRDDVERAQRAVPSIERDVTLGGKVFASYQRAPNPVLFHLDQDEVRAGAHVVLRSVRVNIGREERVRIEGPNGAGKTTLLEALLASVARAQRILYLPQEIGPGDMLALRQRIAETDREVRGQIMAIFAALGSDPERILRGDGEHYSPGETKKLMLAVALAYQVWALVMDEPTNHLDLPSIERLEAALALYPGAVVLVTHDDAFARKLTTRTIGLHQGRVL